jgi:hypothetical protein
MRESYQTYDFFTGKISPFLLFEMEFHSLFYIEENHRNDRFYPEINPVSQVASIGLLAYFEAFCKHQFAAIVNLFPSLIRTFASKREEPRIEFSTIISFSGEFEKNIGFALAENYDFGTAKSINGIFRDLLLITPFDKKEIEEFNEIVYKRNLLVHHAGYYTLQYLKKNAISEELKQRAFKEAVKIDTDEYHKISDFLFEMAMKITRETVKAVKEHHEFKSLPPGNEKINAVEELLQGIHDTLGE